MTFVKAEIVDFDGNSLYQTSTIDVSFASGSALSSAIDLKNANDIAIVMPSAFDSATGTFLASTTLAGPYSSVYNEAGTEASVSFATSRVISFATNPVKSCRYIKIRSGTTASPVVQTAPRTVTIILK